ncbi:MAG TPA: DEAD/DEAH box helicase [Deinococcales bacterium]|nr:DEAD/DEAH box helicase [Deinococcales bacterium]
MLFSDFALDGRILDALSSKNINEPTPVQRETLPPALDGRDVIGQARTGTGKTLAFALPIAERLEPSSERGRLPRALVLTPTRELAIQVATELESVSRHLRVSMIYGGTGYGRQARELKDGVDVVVATPGRALDYMRQGILDLSAAEIVVLDEADEMLSMGFEEDVETMLAATPEGRQTMLFSATMPRWAQNLSAQYLNEPVTVNVVASEEVTYEELAIEAPGRNRLNLLADVLHVHGGGRAIVFTHTKAEVDEIAQGLDALGIPAEAIHGDLNQVQRERVVDRFRRGQLSVLVGTDVAARGLDIPEVDAVVHYRIPSQSANYQHRSGRTGRAGRAGTVVILYSRFERRRLQQLERAVRRRFRTVGAPDREEVQASKLNGLLLRIEDQERSDREQWLPVAREWIAEGKSEEIAGLLTLLLGGAPEEESLLTGEVGQVTLLLSGGRLTAPHVVRLLKDAGASQIGRIMPIWDGAVADVPAADVKGLINRDLEGFRVTRATHIPPAPKRGGGPGGGGRPRGRGGYRRNRRNHGDQRR